MEKTFTYDKVVGRLYTPELDDYEEETVTIKYTVDDEQLLDAVVDLVFEDYFKSDVISDNCSYSSAARDGIRRFIEDDESLSRLVKDYEDRLKDYFEEEAISED